MTEAALTNRMRQIKIPLPTVPRNLPQETQDYLSNLRRAVEANLNALFATDSIEGRRIVDGSIPNVGLENPIDFGVPLLKDVVFSFNAVGAGIIEWTAGTLYYNGTTYTVNAGSTDNGEHSVFVTLAGLSDPVTLGSGEDPPQLATNRWWLAFWDGTRLTAAIQAGIIHGGLIQATTITANQIAADTITANEITANTITASEIAANTITASEIAATTITATEIAANTITAGQIAANAVDTSELNAGAVTATRMTISNLADIATLIAGSMTVGNASTPGVITLVVSPGNGDTKIQTGKSDFTNADSGFILGIDDSDSDLPKFYLGNATEFVNWDGTHLTVTPTLGTLGDSDDFYNIATGAQTITNGSITLVDGANEIIISPANGMTIQGSEYDYGLLLEAYHASQTAHASMRFRMSASNTLGTLVETTDGAALGIIWFEGVSSGTPIRQPGCTLVCTQVGGATASGIAGELDINLFNNAGNATQFIFTYQNLDLDDATLDKFKVGGNAEAVQGSLRVSGNNLECYLNGGWQTAASG